LPHPSPHAAIVLGGRQTPGSARNGEMKTRLGGSPSKDAPLQWRALLSLGIGWRGYQDQHGGWRWSRSLENV